MGDSQTVWPDILNIRQDVFKPDVFNDPHLESIYLSLQLQYEGCAKAKVPHFICPNSVSFMSLDIIIRVLFVMTTRT